MQLRGEFVRRTLVFNFDARTSRGPMKDRDSWIIRLSDRKDERIRGYGECAPLPGLSVDDISGIEGQILESLQGLGRLNDVGLDQVSSVVRACVDERFPAVMFGLETALLDLLHGGKQCIFENDFLAGRRLPINGLVWMGKVADMAEQVIRKVEQGFRCIKIKVGSLDFDEECKLLENIRRMYSARHIELRLDANGAFDESDVMDKLNALAGFDIHSIEQPLPKGAEDLPAVIASSPIPIALDEELIGNEKNKVGLLKEINPHYIILKPGLHGGLFHCADWIKKAEERNIGWWITSALESNIGLNAICQFTARYPVTIPQGLGTGALYSNNFPSPLTVTDGFIYYDEGKSWPDDLLA